MRSFKLVHRNTEFAAGATLILQSLIMLPLHAQNGLSTLKNGVPLNLKKMFKCLNRKEELAIETTHDPP